MPRRSRPLELATITAGANGTVATNEQPNSEKPLIVNVTGQQWWWEYDYPVQDGISQPIITSGQLVIPVGTKVLLRETSRDVIHSYWIPALNGKKDAVPGRIHLLRLEADKPGIYAGQCTEFCGLSHANMRMEAVALSKEDFAKWVAGQQKPYTAPTVKSFGEKKTKRLDIFCPGFPADCLETLEEIAMEVRDDFLTAGGGEYHYISCLNTNPVWISGLAEIAADHLAGWPQLPESPEALALSIQRATELAAKK